MTGGRIILGKLGIYIVACVRTYQVSGTLFSTPRSTGLAGRGRSALADLTLSFGWCLRTISSHNATPPIVIDVMNLNSPLWTSTSN